MSRVVLDASAVLVLLNQEAGSDGIAPFLKRCRKPMFHTTSAEQCC
jgi:PIN domain nuclease of toxin-antitoxin system